MFRSPAPFSLRCLLICLGAMATWCTADAPDAATVTVIGVVKPAAPAAEEAATVKMGTVTYKIVKDDKGKVVARDAGGKKAELRGTVAERDGVKWITVTWCALVE